MDDIPYELRQEINAFTSEFYDEFDTFDKERFEKLFKHVFTAINRKADKPGLKVEEPEPEPKPDPIVPPWERLDNQAEWLEAKKKVMAEFVGGLNYDLEVCFRGLAGFPVMRLVRQLARWQLPAYGTSPTVEHLKKTIGSLQRTVAEIEAGTFNIESDS